MMDLRANATGQAPTFPDFVLQVLQGPSTTLPPEQVAQLKPHPKVKAFGLSDRAFAAPLYDDIRQTGLLQPIVVLGNWIVDGRRRLVACRDTGNQPRFLCLPPAADPYVYQLYLSLNRAQAVKCAPNASIIGERKAAEYLNIPVLVLSRWRLNREVPHFRVMGKFICYRKADLDTWQAQHRPGR